MEAQRLKSTRRRKRELYFSETLQLRAFLSNKYAKYGLLASYLGCFIIYLILILGRPEDDYWTDEADVLGGEVNLTLCENPKLTEFVRLRANAFSTLAPIYVSLFILLMFVLDLRDRIQYDSSVGNKPASILLRFPIWSLFFSLNFMFLGVSGLLFFASTLSLFSIIFTVAQWSTILSLALCSVNRLIDPPKKAPHALKKCFGYVFVTLFMVSNLFLTIFLVLNLEGLAESEEVQSESSLTTLESELPVAVMYSLVFIGVVCAIINWRTQALTIRQQPVLLFLGGIIALAAVGFDSYDNDDGVACFPNSGFQLGAFGFVILNIAGLVAYLFFRADAWDDTIKEDTVKANRHNLSVASIEIPETASANGSTLPRGRSPQPQELGGSRGRGQPAPGAPQGLVRGLDHMFRRATTEIATSPMVTPELGFSTSQIRLAEIAIGLVIIGFIIAVIYFSFSS